MNPSSPVSGTPYRDLDAALAAFRNEAGNPRRARTAEELCASADTLLACELARCRSRMTAQQWAEHREWIEENARASLRGTLRTRGPGAAMKTPPPDIKVDPVFPGDEAGVLVARSAFSRRGIEKAAQRRAEHGDVQAQREASFGRARDAANDAPPAWPAITPLPDGELAAVQSFDMMLLPGALRPWAEDIVSHMQCPPDFVGVTIMGALGMVIGRRVGIPPRRATTGPNTATCGSAWWAVPP